MAKTPEKIKYTKGDVTIETADVGEGVNLRANGFHAEPTKGKSTGGQSSTGGSSGGQGRSQS